MYLVDGNNVMGQRVGWHRDRPAARKRLVEELVGLAGAERSPITVVFDGPADAELSDGWRSGRLTVRFAGRGSDADRRIVALVRRLRAPSRAVVVTSDRELAAAVAALGARVMRSGELRRRIEGGSR